MSVAFHKMTSEIVFIGGRAEALWMKDYLPNDEIGDMYTKFYISEKNIREAVGLAWSLEKTGNVGEEFGLWQGQTSKEEMLKEHRRITRDLPKTLRKMLAQQPKDKQCPRAAPYFEIEVGW